MILLLLTILSSPYDYCTCRLIMVQSQKGMTMLPTDCLLSHKGVGYIHVAIIILYLYIII